MQTFKFDFLLKSTQTKRKVTQDVCYRFFVTDNYGDPVCIGHGQKNKLTDWATGLTLQHINILRDLLSDNEITSPGGKSKALPKQVMDLPTALRKSELRNKRFADADEANEYLDNL